MGRFLSGGGAGALPRKQSIRLTASNPSVAIPSWARVARVTGTAPGGGGGNSGSTTDRGGGGGAGGWANGLPLQINGETTLAVVIGALGTGAAGGSNSAGGNAGNTTVTIGNTQLRLGGGSGGGGSPSGGGASGAGGLSIIGRPDDANAFPSAAADGTPYGTLSVSYGTAGTYTSASPLGPGASGTAGNVAARGAGGMSVFGGAGRRDQAAAANQAGGATSGFGGGGGGGNGTGPGSDGAPGFILIEFEEAF